MWVLTYESTECVTLLTTNSSTDFINSRWCFFDIIVTALVKFDIFEGSFYIWRNNKAVLSRSCNALYSLRTHCVCTLLTITHHYFCFFRNNVRKILTLYYRFRKHIFGLDITDVILYLYSDAFCRRTDENTQQKSIFHFVNPLHSS